jgi:uncharacterized membrane-anchored protein YitT (DUF2179 family)
MASITNLVRAVPRQFSWQSARDFLYIVVGTLLQALALRLFQEPAHLATGGISGIAQMINYFTEWPIGVMIFLGNLPLFIVGWRFLGGARFVLRTAFAIVAVSFFIEILAPYIDPAGLTEDLFLNALYGAIVSGIGYGLVYRGRGTSGGSDILARILNNRFGVSLTQSYLLTDAAVMFLAGLVFSWENALYALVMLYITGLAAEAVNEGSNVLRTVLVITSQPQQVAGAILHEMERGVTVMDARGAYTGAERTVLYCVISRDEVAQVKALVKEVDPQAFMVIGHAHEALGEGFRPF